MTMMLMEPLLTGRATLVPTVAVYTGGHAPSVFAGLWLPHDVLYYMHKEQHFKVHLCKRDWCMQDGRFLDSV